MIALKLPRQKSNIPLHRIISVSLQIEVLFLLLGVLVHSYSPSLQKCSTKEVDGEIHSSCMGGMHSDIDGNGYCAEGLQTGELVYLRCPPC